MDFNSEVGSLSQNDSSSAASCTVSGARYRLEETVSPQEQWFLQLLRGAFSETTEENNAFGKEISTFLSTFNLDLVSLPSDIKDGLQKLALILRAEKLSDFDDIALDVVMQKRKVEESRKWWAENKRSLMYDQLLRKYTNFSKKVETLQEAVGSLEERIINEKRKQEESYSNRVLLSTKLQEYQQAVEKLEIGLKDIGVDDLYPNKILSKYQKYLEMSTELKDLAKHLSQYRELPPNLVQAKALLESKQKEYEKLEEQFLKKMDYS